MSGLNTGDDMADDTPQRPYRSNLPPTRGPAASIPVPAAAGNDPLAELARLIGQNDPFSEFGQNGARRVNPAATAPASPPPRPNEALEWPPTGLSQPQSRPTNTRDLPPVPQRQDYAARMPEPAAPPLADPQAFGAGGFGRSPFGGDYYPAEPAQPAYGGPAFPPQTGGFPPQPAGFPPQTGDFPAQTYGVPGFPPQGGADFDHQHDAFGDDYGQDPYQQDHDPHQAPGYGQFGPQSDDYYDDDAPSGGRRIGVIAIAGIFALAVIGTAGAFGYRAIFGSSGSSGPPPVIKADSTPSKIVPASAGRDAQDKTAASRPIDPTQGERLVSREEQPVAVTAAKPGNVIFPQDATQGQGQIQNNPVQLGSGIVGGDPKRIHTLVIRPDQAEAGNAGGSMADAAPQGAAPAPQPTAIQPRVTNVTPVRAASPPPPPPPAPRQVAEPAPRQVATRAEPAPVENAPLSLNPNAATARRAPARTAPQYNTASAPVRVAPTVAGGGYAVQVTARRSEQDAQADFRNLQSRFPDQLGGRQALIKRADLGAKGVYYRAMIGPFGSSAEANEVCSSLKAAGGACIVQKN